MTLILDSNSTKKLSLIKELAIELGIKVVETPKKPIAKTISQKEIMELSKKVNKAMTKRMFEKLGIDYDSYNR